VRLVSFSAAFLIPILAAAQTSAPPHGELTLHSGAQEVLLDFVARDKHQRAVTDLRPEEVRIYEDGVLQHPNSFHYRGGSDAPIGATTAASDHIASDHIYDALKEMNVVSVVFETMGAQTRRRATGFVNEFLDTGIGPNTWIGVFTLNHQLSVVQPYTTDLSLVHQAVERAGTGAYQQFAKESLDIVRRINSLVAVQDQSNVRFPSGAPASPGTFQPLSPGSAQESGPAGGLGALAAVEAHLQQLTLKTLYQQTGARTIDALRGWCHAPRD
jgi:VWFA-related protein